MICDYSCYVFYLSISRQVKLIPHTVAQKDLFLSLDSFRNNVHFQPCINNKFWLTKILCRFIKMIFLQQVLHTWPQQWLHPFLDRNCENPPGMPAYFKKEKHVVYKQIANKDTHFLI